MYKPNLFLIITKRLQQRAEPFSFPLLAQGWRDAGARWGHAGVSVTLPQKLSFTPCRELGELLSQPWGEL